MGRGLTREQAEAVLRVQERVISPLARIPIYLFLLVGLTMLGGAGWALAQRLVVLKTWPETQAEVTRSKMFSHVVTTNRQEKDSIDSSRTRTVSTSTTMYGAQLEFRYTVNGREYNTPTGAGYEISDAGRMSELVSRYAVGSRHPIRYDPSDPSDIRIEADTAMFFAPLLIVGALGMISTGIGVRLWRSYARRTAELAKIRAAARQ
ncbi:MAG TPA: DUF3592 domain-containing protein [Terriglobales bacterium]|nr:DUF3592 domain-containing protein [Terriglobales bacterium]